MIDLGVKDDLGWRHWVIVGKEELGLEFASFKACALWPCVMVGIPSIETKKCLKLLGSGEQEMPGIGSLARVFVSLTTLGEGPSILINIQ